MPYWMRFLQHGGPIRFDEGEPAGGPPPNNPPPQPPPNNPPPAETPVFLPEAARPGFDAALYRHGRNAMSLAAELFVDNYNVREQNRQLKQQQPAQGAVVLSPEDAKKWKAYQELGDPAELKTQLATAAETKARLDKAERDAVITKAAEGLNWKAPVLVDRVTVSGITVVLKEETVDGEKVQVPYATWKEGTKGSEVQKEAKLEEYAKEKWADFLPALEAGAEQQQAPRGTQFPSTRTVTPPPRRANGSATKGVAGSFLGSRYGAKREGK